MIAAWMLWSIGVGLLLLVAGLAAERLFEGRRRWVWAVACAGTVLLTAVRVFATGGSGSEDLSGGLVMTEVAAPGTNAAGALEGVEAGTGTLPGTSSPAFLPVAIPHDSVLHTLDGILLTGLAGPVRGAGAMGSDRGRKASPSPSRLGAGNAAGPTCTVVARHRARDRRPVPPQRGPAVLGE